MGIKRDALSMFLVLNASKCAGADIGSSSLCAAGEISILNRESVQTWEPVRHRAESTGPIWRVAALLDVASIYVETRVVVERDVNSRCRRTIVLCEVNKRIPVIAYVADEV